MSKAKEILNGWRNLVVNNDFVEEIAQVRAEICSECPHAVPGLITRFIPEKKLYENINGLKCNKCGCPLSAKVRSLGSECPIGKWLEIMNISKLMSSLSVMKMELLSYAVALRKKIQNDTKFMDAALEVANVENYIKSVLSGSDSYEAVFSLNKPDNPFTHIEPGTPDALLKKASISIDRWILMLDGAILSPSIVGPGNNFLKLDKQKLVNIGISLEKLRKELDEAYEREEKKEDKS